MIVYKRGDITRPETPGYYRVINGYHGIAMGGLENNARPYGGMMYLDGINDYVNLGNNGNVRTYDFAVWGWATIDSTTGIRILLSKSNNGWLSTLDGLEIRASSSFINMMLGDGSGNYCHSYYGFTIPTNTPFFWLGIFDRTNSYAHLYFNGQAVTVDPGNIAGDLSTVGDVNNTYDLLIGNLAYYYWLGGIGLSGMYLFDGIDGRQNGIPSDVDGFASDLYKWATQEFNKYSGV